MAEATVGSLGFEDDKKIRAASLASIPALVQLLWGPHSSAKIQELTSMALKQLAVNKGNRLAILAAGTVEPLMILSQTSRDIDVKIAATMALSAITK